MRRRVDTRHQILERALRLASVEGLQGMSIGRLAEDVGMSKSGLFAHFRSKEELELDVLSAAIVRFTEVVVRPALRAARGEPRVRALFDRWLSWGRHESMPGGCIFVQLAVELDDRPGATRDALIAGQRRWIETLAKAARLAVEVGHFRPDLDAELFAFQQYGLVLSYYHRKRLLHDPNAERLVAAGFDALLASARALLPAAAADPR